MGMGMGNTKPTGSHALRGNLGDLAFLFESEPRCMHSHAEHGNEERMTTDWEGNEGKERNKRRGEDSLGIWVLRNKKTAPTQCRSRFVIQVFRML